ncbi:hypothetical protein SIN8267_03456 [Sinobacterium norvegicum]|uniref:Glycoside hydrolase 123 C-terminal domain-containing protein n=2 Tax=Sinobacterium norvegicum TaxID=1641715 RepID=A0ABN8EQN4_9GAMM|nr:hypothetical protein SIN8267_03456 [Sinobacterium norvegicum]
MRLLSLLSIVISINTNAIDILSIEPVYNRQDGYSQLLDGAVSSTLQVNSLGTIRYSYVNPVVVSIDVGEDMKLTGLSVHVQIKKKSSVYGLQKLSLYEEHHGGYRFLADKVLSPGMSVDGGAWVDIEVVGYAKKYKIVMHVDGKLLFLDEIKVSAERYNGNSDQPNHADYVDDVVSDSYSRFEKKENTTNARLRVFDPVVDLVSGESIEVEANKTLKILHYGVDNSDVNIGLELNTLDEQRYSVFVNDCSGNNIGHSLSELQVVQANDGQYVYDVVMPLKMDQRIGLKSGKYMLTVKGLDRLLCDEYLVSVSMEEKNYQVVIKSQQYITETIPAEVMLWGYPQDGVLWSKPQEAIDYLRGIGVNNFLIHPSDIPKFDGRSSNIKSTIEKYNNVEGDRYYLFLAWLPNRNPLIRKDKHEQIRIVKDWIDDLKEITNISNVVVYIHDEPNNLERIKFNYDVARLFKQVDPDIQLYTNPDFSRLNSYQQIKYVELYEDVFDIIQPLDKYASVFSTLSKRNDYDLWTYGVPRYPAKSSSPIEYQQLGIKAGLFGAKGVGVWSYSAIGGKSEWLDYDGYKADWNLSYGSDSGILDSVRMKAFKRGLQDYKLIRHHINKGCKVGDIAKVTLLSNKLYRFGLYRKALVEFCRGDIS